MEVIRGEEKFVVAEGNDWFWKIFADGSWEPGTFRIFDKFLDKNKDMLDIGAWIGPTALYASSRAKRVFAFEPDAVAYFNLIKNLAFNKLTNVIPYPIAVSNEWKGINFGHRTAAGDSMSSELWGTGDMQVAAAAFDALVGDIEPGFIKIDIEGGEKYIFDSAGLELERVKPTIHLSLHTPWHLDDLEDFKKHIIDGLAMYPFFYDENLQPTTLEDAFNINAFTSVVASFKQI